MKAQPGPIVSGSHFLPKAPLLWVKRIPAWAVMSLNWIWACAVRTRQEAINHRDTEDPRDFGKQISPCLRDSVLNSYFDGIYREAPGAPLASLRWTVEAAVPTCVVVTGSGTDSCSWMDCRSLLSSGCSCRYGPVIACEDSSALKRM